MGHSSLVTILDILLAGQHNVIDCPFDIEQLKKLTGGFVMRTTQQFSTCSLDSNPNRGEGFENDGERVSERSGTTNISIITVARLRSPLTYESTE